VHPLNDVSTVVEDAPDVFSVHCAGEMGITIVPSISAGCADPLKRSHRREGIHYHIWLSGFVRGRELKMVEAREVLPVAPDVLEEVEGLLQPVGLIVFPDHHVVAATGHHKDNGRLTIKTLNPLSAFIPLTSNIKHTGSGEKTMRYSASQQVLISRRVVTLSDPPLPLFLHVNLDPKVGGYLLLCTVDQLVLIGSLKAGLHPLVLPKGLSMLIELLQNNTTQRTGSGQYTAIENVDLGPTPAALVYISNYWMIER
uniref:Uncharacterized protein n=1 Tax=Salmo trutta TaxID=8032 RepID=A0A673Z735_SALTR